MFSSPHMYMYTQYSYMLFDPLIVWTFEGHEPQDLRDNISLSTPVTTCVHDNAEQAEQICSVIKKNSQQIFVCKQET